MFGSTGQSPTTYVSGDAFGVADISTIDPSSITGLGRIPAGVSPKHLLAKGSSATQRKSEPLSYAVWTFKDGNGMSDAVKASMQSGTTARFLGVDFPPNGYSNPSGSIARGISEARSGGLG